MIDSRTQKKIIELWLAGDSKLKISKKLGVAYNTVRSYINKHGLNSMIENTDDDDIKGLINQLAFTLQKLNKAIEKKFSA